MKFLSISLLYCSTVAALAPKKILLSFDGTGNNARDFQPDPVGDVSITNVLKLHLLAGGDIDNKVNSVDGQVCLYKRGVGGTSDSKAMRTLNTILGDLNQQTDPMREMLEECYNEGDKLYVIGYSRGAASARKFVCDLDRDGLKTSSGGFVEKPSVEFLGCFETVAMQVKKRLLKILKNDVKGGITPSSALGEIDGKIPSIVKTAVHNVALDDNRFRTSHPPCYMDSADERVHESFFPGEHGDIGGTYFKKGLPDGSCLYMQEWMESLDEPLKFISNTEIADECLKVDAYPEVDIDKKDLDLTPNAADIFHLGEEQLNDPCYRPVATVTNEELVEGTTVKIHESVLDHLEANKDYPINPNIKEADVVVVGSLEKTLHDKTKRLKELLAQK